MTEEETEGRERGTAWNEGRNTGDGEEEEVRTWTAVCNRKVVRESIVTRKKEK